MVLAEIEVADDEPVLDVDDVALDELVCEALLARLKTLAVDCVTPVVGFDAVVFFDVSA
jgi:hypothetical protein